MAKPRHETIALVEALLIKVKGRYGPKQLDEVAGTVRDLMAKMDRQDAGEED